MLRNIFKYFIFSILLVFNVQAGSVFALENDPTAAMNRALSNNDAKLLGMMMDNMITISIKNRVNIYSKSQAQKVVSDFFVSEKNAVFKLHKHGSDPKTHIYYGIGTYKTNAKTFIVYYLLRYSASEGEYVLKELKIDNA